MKKTDKEKLKSLLERYKLIIADEKQNGRYEFASGDLDKTFDDINSTLEMVALMPDDEDLSENGKLKGTILSDIGIAFMSLGNLRKKGKS